MPRSLRLAGVPSSAFYLDRTMEVRLVITVGGIGASDSGAKMQEEITPEPIWIERGSLRDRRKQEPRLPRDPWSLIISATKGRPATRTTGN